MLYDPKWSETKSPPVMPTTADEILRGLIAWLEGQPGETTYLWSDGKDCLFARYSRFLGNEDYPYNRLYKLVRGPDDWRLHQLEGDVALTRPWTYAAALDRARGLL